jgi:type I restriction enzyme M protein
MPSSNGHVTFIQSIAERLRGAFKRHEYGSIMLPLTLLRRLDQVLEPTKAEVLQEAAKYEGRGLNMDPILRRAAKQRFYNTSPLSLSKVIADPDHAATQLRAYVAGFDAEVRDLFEAFDFDATITKLEKADRLFSVLGKFLDSELDLHPDEVPNDVMGDIFEELIRRFAEMSNETAGEHFTPREVVRLCAELVLAGDDELVSTTSVVRTVYDPACGTGGMLSVAEELVRERNATAQVVPFGQELNPESWAICRAEMLVKGQDPSRIYPASTLSEDGTAGRTFDFMLANPPFGVDWDDDHDFVVKENEQLGFQGRFGAGVPRKSDGALLFLQNMLAKMKPAEAGGSRVAIVFNGSPLFSGGAGSGESEIRRWLIEQDYLEAVVALPEQLFYNTPLGTYIWVLTNMKEARRSKLVQLIDARALWEPMPRSLGDKRRRLSLDHIDEIVQLRSGFEAEAALSKVRPLDFFAYTRVVVERPLRLRYRGGGEAAEMLEVETAFGKLAVPAKNSADPAGDRARGEAKQAKIASFVRALSDLDADDLGVASDALKPLWDEIGGSAALRKAVTSAMSVRDPDAKEVMKGTAAEPDPLLRTTEQVPVQESIEEYMKREVLSYVPDAWVDEDKNRLGYEVPMVRLFFTRPELPGLEELDVELTKVAEQLSEALGRLSR